MSIYFIIILYILVIVSKKISDRTGKSGFLGRLKLLAPAYVHWLFNG